MGSLRAFSTGIFIFGGPQRNLVASTKFMPLAWRLNIPLCAQSPRPKLRVRHAELFICEVELSYRGLFLLVAIPVVMMMVARIVGIKVMVAMMIAVVAMMVIAVPRCGWDSAAGRDYANDSECRSDFP